MFKRDSIDVNWISNQKELFFFKLHDKEIFHTYEGSKNMNYSMMPPIIKEAPVSHTGDLGKSELGLRRSQIPSKPDYQDSDDILRRKSYFNARGTQ